MGHYDDKKIPRYARTSGDGNNTVKNSTTHNITQITTSESSIHDANSNALDAGVALRAMRYRDDGYLKITFDEKGTVHAFWNFTAGEHMGAYVYWGLSANDDVTRCLTGLFRKLVQVDEGKLKPSRRP